MDKDDVIITSLKTLGIQSGLPVKKKVVPPEDLGNLSPLSLGKGDKSFLLIGANEGNTDAIMVVHLDGETNKGTIVSVPRDLYYKGRKINTIYPLYGPEELKKTISEITGLPIERYMFIDMFAFADVVDLLGGIDIVLNEPLIDPTYVVKNNGKWSTLHYEAGPHHIGGVESLRIARSRHTSDDFGRAERQQMLLMSLKDKISEMNAGSITKITDLINVLMNYVRTDFSVFELMTIFTHHRNDEIKNYVLSWDNVLYHTYSNLYLLDDDVEVDENFNKGAWIMLPLKNDWNVIRWYVRDIISGGQDG
jgi:LCP family protein required for cell wall assembly